MSLVIGGAIGGGLFLLLKGLNHIMRDHAQTFAAISYARAQRRRNAVVMATRSHIVIDDPQHEYRVENARDVTESYHYQEKRTEELPGQASSLAKPTRLLDFAAESEQTDELA